MAKLTRALRQIEAGDDRAREQLVELLYEELKEVARKTPRERYDTLNTTVLAHDALLRLGLLETGAVGMRDSRELFRAIARAMTSLTLKVISQAG